MPANDSFADGPSIVRLARELADRRDTEHLARALAGRNLALISNEADPALNMFYSAAIGLGARVSHIRPNLTEQSDPEEIRQTARMLGKLYAALEWPDAPPALLEQLEKEAAIPVFDGISRRDHPLARLSEQFGIDTPADARWRLLIQAVLLRTLQ